MYIPVPATLLYINPACKWPDWLDVVKLLIEEYGVDPNVTTNSNQSLLHYACRCDCIDIVNYLIKKCLNQLLQEWPNAGRGAACGPWSIFCGPYLTDSNLRPEQIYSSVAKRPAMTSCIN